MKLFFISLLVPLWRLFDYLTPKKNNYWAFSTHHINTERFIENQRALFEHVKKDPSIRKIIFYRGSKPDFQIEDGLNYEIIRYGSLRSFLLLSKCKVVLLTHSIAMDFSLRWGAGRFTIIKLAMRKRVVVNLWHGIPLKRLLYAANDDALRHTDRVKYRTEERKNYRGLVSSSAIDSYAMAAMFYPLNYRQIWITGLPRNDFLTQEKSQLPKYIAESLNIIAEKKNNKRLIIYAPTYRQVKLSRESHYYQFSTEEINELKKLLKRSNSILGYRPHYFKNSEQYFNMDQYIDNEFIIDMSQKTIPEFSAIARELDLLITDYSSVYMEALYLNKPMLCFGYDIEHYKKNEDGLLYDMNLAFPGKISTSFQNLLKNIEETIHKTPIEIKNEQAVAHQLFFEHKDNLNSQRVKEKIEQHLRLKQ